MKRLAALCCGLVLAGCATTPAAPPGTVVADAKIAQAVQPGLTTRAMLLAQFGPTTSIRFDSGVEVWRYLLAGAPGSYGEYVIVLDPRGVVAKARRATIVYQTPPQK
jgi:F0F1-type ATP synthase membrane subunit c/vacuolar-type H+-ATPase subunit K